VREILHQQEELPALLKKTTMFLLAGVEEYISEVKNQLCSVLRDSIVADKVSVVPNPRILYHTGDTKSENDGDGFGCEAIVAEGLLELVTNSKLPHSNLLPQQYARRHKQKALLLRYLLTGSFSLVLVLLVLLCLVVTNWRTERMSRMIESQIAPIEYTASTVDSKRQRLSAIQKQLSNHGQITAVIDELYRYTPKAISISELRIVSKHSGTSIEIKGQADLLSTAFDYTDAMSKAELLNRIQIENAQQILRPGGSVIVFKAYCDIQED
jgi:Tfp pilus assembly protein PilN